MTFILKENMFKREFNYEKETGSLEIEWETLEKYFLEVQDTSANGSTVLNYELYYKLNRLI